MPSDRFNNVRLCEHADAWQVDAYIAEYRIQLCGDKIRLNAIY